jgi:hypothetical protein
VGVQGSDIQEVFEHWNKEAIVVHKTLDKQMRKVIQSVLSEYDKDRLKEAITLYAQVLHDPASSWTYKWRIEEFFKRVPGFRHFLPESKPLEKFYQAGFFGTGGTTPPVPPVSPAVKEDFLIKKQKIMGDKLNDND